MMLARFFGEKFSPLTTIEWVAAVYTFVGGAYIFTPLYAASKAANGPGVIASALTHPALIFIFGALLVVGALMVMFGLWRDKPQFKSAGWFVMFLVRFFQVLTTLLTVGFLPITWIYPATLATIMLVLWTNARIQVRVHAAS